MANKDYVSHIKIKFPAGFTEYQTRVFRIDDLTNRIYGIKDSGSKTSYTIYSGSISNPNTTQSFLSGYRGNYDYNNQNYFPPESEVNNYNYTNNYQLWGYGGTETAPDGATYTLETTQVPLFKNRDDAIEYVRTGNDSKAVNYEDLHSSTVDFYLTNNGTRISIKYDLPQGQTVDDVSAYKLDSYSVTFHSDVSGSNNDVVYNTTADTFTTSWDSIISAMIQSNPTAGAIESTLFHTIKTLRVTIVVTYNNVPTSTLVATITRKLVGVIGNITATPVIGEDNGYRLFCSTDNRFDDISTPSQDVSNATSGNNDGSSFGGFSSFLATYQISNQALSDLGNFIWQNSLFDNIKLLNNSPLENIVACHYMPCDIGGVSNKIVLGNIETEITGKQLDQNLIKVEIANFYMPLYSNDFTAYEPYTSVSLYLPLVGMIDLQPKDICGYNVIIEYVYDVVCGSFGVLVYTTKGGGKTLIYSSSGVCSVNIPLTASNQAQVQSSILTSGVSLISDVISGNAMGAISEVTEVATIQNHSQTFGSPSSMVGALSPNYCYYIIRTPITKLPSNFAHTIGYMCMEAYKLSQLQGYTELVNVDLSNFNATETEKDEIYNILTTGFYI